MKADDLSSVLSNLEEALDPEALRKRYAKTLSVAQEAKVGELELLRDRLLASEGPDKPQRAASARSPGSKALKPSGGLVRAKEVPLRRAPPSTASWDSNLSNSSVTSEGLGLLDFLMKARRDREEVRFED